MSIRARALLSGKPQGPLQVCLVCCDRRADTFTAPSRTYTSASNARSGASSLGFIGIALAAVIETTHPVSSEYSGGMVEWWLQIVGAILSQVRGG
jgi:hypothetical protein